MPAWISIRLDSPVSVTPFSTQVARARSDPKPPGTLAMRHEPSGCTWTVRLRIEMTQFSLSWAWAGSDCRMKGLERMSNNSNRAQQIIMQAPSLSGRFCNEP